MRQALVRAARPSTYHSARRLALAFLTLDELTSLLAAMCLYAGAYMAEVFRAAILTVDKRFHEAWRALGLGEPRTDSELPRSLGQALGARPARAPRTERAP